MGTAAGPIAVNRMSVKLLVADSPGIQPCGGTGRPVWCSTSASCRAEEVYLRSGRRHAVAAAIRDMAVRGAPAIGVAAAFGHRARRPPLGRKARRCARTSSASARSWRGTRPTAVNLFWAIARMSRRFEREPRGAGRRARRAAGGSAGHPGGGRPGLPPHGRPRRRAGPAGARLLTHCNAGALATAGYGTALGVIRSAARRGQAAARLRRRDAALPPGRAADRLGADAGRHPHHPDRGQHGRPPDGARRDGRGGGGRRPHRRQRRRGQQDRHLHAGGAGPRARHPVLRGGAGLHHRPGHRHRRRTSPSRSGRRRR